MIDAPTTSAYVLCIMYSTISRLHKITVSYQEIVCNILLGKSPEVFFAFELVLYLL